MTQKCDALSHFYRLEVELSLEDMGKPIGVADYQLLIPKEELLQVVKDEFENYEKQKDNEVRQSKATALARNKFICDTADQIVFVGVKENSSLYPLSIQYTSKHQNIK